MSLILDALHKADRERQTNQQASSFSQQQAYRHEDSEKGSRWLIICLFLAVIMMAGLSFLFFIETRKSANESVNKQTDKPLIKKQIVNADLNSTNEKRVISEINADETLSSSKTVVLPPNEGIDKRIAAQYERASIKLNTEKPTQEHLEADASAVSDVNPIQSLYAIQKDSEPDDSAMQKPLDAIAQYPDLGVIRDLPLSVQNNIPTLMYAEHKYDPSGNSYVIINNQKFKQGNIIEGICSLERILTDGIIIKHQDYRFTLKALNSWVNM